MSQIIPFQFETHALRVQVDDASQPWFNANDVCAALELANPRDALAKHVDSDDVAKRDIIDSLGRVQLASFVNESGLYSLILGSVNDRLAEMGLQVRNDRDEWELTEEGRAWGEALPYSRNGHSGYQILWNPAVIDPMKKVA